MVALCLGQDPGVAHFNDLRFTVDSQWDPMQPTIEVAATKASIQHAARANGLKPFLRATFVRPTASTRRAATASSAELLLTLEETQRGWDEGAAAFYHIVSAHIALSNIDIPRVKWYERQQDGPGLYQWFLQLSQASVASAAATSHLPPAIPPPVSPSPAITPSEFYEQDMISSESNVGKMSEITSSEIQSNTVHEITQSEIQKEIQSSGFVGGESERASGQVPGSGRGSLGMDFSPRVTVSQSLGADFGPRVTVSQAIQNEIQSSGYLGGESEREIQKNIEPSGFLGGKNEPTARIIGGRESERAIEKEIQPSGLLGGETVYEITEISVHEIMSINYNELRPTTTTALRDPPPDIPQEEPPSDLPPKEPPPKEPPPDPSAVHQSGGG
eukprot:CAMPEP_0119343912 /NCGR_PEP_ID=MMETSP1333-20130426/106700_1 /TAXON_ID=418940 /ORGANISM="Scyphosphaera apsteinii, Strain RCC1455" /LENGTH=387 /DNA_ID=CAMNT_0007356333 /DNA_START=775 /DNA_END=1938 /DNA_ORIENTATION=-